ncbi:hypothetical protein ACK8HX_00770 [Oryzobacter sp. R7]|uniref:hypothetical protein n=1 Tax=Oryzobacter faecalis TaxID=3388656 RepID=UPI00398D4845
MSRPTPRPARPAARLLPVVGALAVALVAGGCGTATDALVGIEPAPAERTAAAPLDTDGATAIATRLLTAAEAPADGDAAAQKAARARTFTGDALTLAEARAARKAQPPTGTALVTGPTPKVLAQSQGRAWPRAILATSLDADDNTQYLHVLLSEQPDEAFRIAATVPMFAGAQLPAVGSASEGAPLLDTGSKEGLAASPEAVLKAWAGALAYPKPRPTKVVDVTDPFAEGLTRAAAGQAKALGKLATLSQVHSPQLEHALTFRLADGGAVTFALVKRTDTITLKPTAKELVLPKEYADVVGKAKVTRSMKLENLEAVAVVVPESGAASVIGASELLVSGTGR